MKLQTFIQEFTARLAPLQREFNVAWWDTNTSGDPTMAERIKQISAQRMQLFTDPTQWQQVRKWYGQRDQIADPLLRRQLELLYLEFAANQRTPEQIEQIATLESELEAIFASFRGTVN